MLPIWRMIAFLARVVFVFIAVASPLDTFSETLLFMHMAQHFVLMSVAPPLIVMGSPFVPLVRGMPVGIVRKIAKFFFVRPPCTWSGDACVDCMLPGWL